MSRNAKIILLIILALLFFAEAGFAAYIVLHRSKDHSSGSLGNTSQTESSSAKDACKIFTLADAKLVLNGNATGGTMSVTASSPDVQVSGCSYKAGNTSSSSVTAAKTASLVVHRPKTAEGITSNLKIFSANLPPGAQPVTGYGDKAFWDPQLGQLNIIKKNIWYVLTYGATTPAGRSLAQAKQLADVLAPKL